MNKKIKIWNFALIFVGLIMCFFIFLVNVNNVSGQSTSGSIYEMKNVFIGFGSNVQNTSSEQYSISVTIGGSTIENSSSENHSSEVGVSLPVADMNDSYPPEVVNISYPDTNVTENFTIIRIITNEPTFCRYCFAQDRPYEEMDPSTQTNYGTIHVWNITGLVNGTYLVYIRCLDGANNEVGNSEQIILNVSINPIAQQISLPSGISAGNSGGGGGGGSSAKKVYNESQEISETQYWKVLNPRTHRMIIQNPVIRFSEILFNVSTSFDDAWIRVTMLPERPGIIGEKVNGAVYKYFLIESNRITNEEITGSVITFKVKKKWMEENNFEVNSISLAKYVADDWRYLEADYFGSDEEYYYYKTYTYDFLTAFAIVVKGKTQKDITYNEPEIVDTTSTRSSVSSVSGDNGVIIENPKEKPSIKKTSFERIFYWLAGIVIFSIILIIAIFVLKAKSTSKEESKSDNINNPVYEYIDKERKRGFSYNQIRDKLLSVGWRQEVVDKEIEKHSKSK